MKKLKGIFSLLLIAVMLFGASACNNTDPNVVKQTESEKDFSVAIDTPSQIDEAVNSEVFKNVDLDYYANRSYELRYLLAQESFASPSAMSVNALVQYSFCHLFYENLCEMPKTGMVYREASEEEMKKEIEKQFGPVTTDIKQANLYTSGKHKFEMFEPNYGTEIFYDVEGHLLKGGGYQVKTVFYTDSTESTVLGTTFLNLGEYNGNIVINSLRSKQG